MTSSRRSASGLKELLVISMSEGNYWFRRLQKDATRMSPHIRFKRIKYGFYRIYLKQAYIGECSKDMPEFGYDIQEKNWNFEDRSFATEYEDLMDQTAKLKNFREGYWESVNRLQTKIYMFKHNKEFYDTALRGYSQMRIK